MDGVNKSEGNYEQLIPGIPDDVTLDFITPKLLWSDLRVLFETSPRWQEAAQLVYNTTLRTHSTESFAVFTQSHHLYSLPGKGGPHIPKTISMYSPRDKSLHKIPPIPGFRLGIPRCCQTLSLDTKLYVLGGLTELDLDHDPQIERDSHGDFDNNFFNHGSTEVHVLDFIGKLQWKRCASMQESRSDFASIVREGKIYVFGGTDYEHRSHRCEVYDPKVDTWTWIQPMPTFRRKHQIATMGEELVLYGGIFNAWLAGEGLPMPYLSMTSAEQFVEVYHPVNDEWRVIRNNGIAPIVPILGGQCTLSVPGNFFHLIGTVIPGDTYVPGGIYFYHNHKRFWTRLQVSPHPESGGYCFWSCNRGGYHYWIVHLLVVGNELLALVGKTGAWDRCLLQSSGFHQADEQVVWSKTMILRDDPSFLCSIKV